MDYAHHSQVEEQDIWSGHSGGGGGGGEGETFCPLHSLCLPSHTCTHHSLPEMPLPTPHYFTHIPNRTFFSFFLLCIHTFLTYTFDISLYIYTHTTYIFKTFQAFLSLSPHTFTLSQTSPPSFLYLYTDYYPHTHGLQWERGKEEGGGGGRGRTSPLLPNRLMQLEGYSYIHHIIGNFSIFII